MIHLKIIQLFVLIFFLSCNRWEYNDLSDQVEPNITQTYLSLIALDTIFSTVDSLGNIIYAINEFPDSDYVWDTLSQAFTTITSSRQELHWWGEDTDGDIIGYRYKWSSDSSWTFTGLESGVFYVPIRSDLDVFSFEVKAVDNDGNEDLTPSRLIFPIKNSSDKLISETLELVSSFICLAVILFPAST